MAGNLTAMIAAAFSGGAAPPVTSDPYFEYTTLLLPGNGTNGAQNNTFLDGSTNNFTITRNGNTTQGTFSPFSQTGWSNYFDGSADYLTYGSNAAFTFGTGDFTVEAWVYITASASFSIFNVGGASTGSYSLYWWAPTQKFESVRYGDVGGATTNTYSINQWMHIAAVRSSGTSKLYINGVEDTGATYAMGNCSMSSAESGRIWQGSAVNNGYISNLRVVKGTAVYTANFTPPTAPLTAISGTSLLTCQSNRFVDNSTNNFTITPNGSPSVQAFSPFNPSASWSAATYGGSGYFDGNTDYLTVPQSAGALDLGSGQFSLEFWWYPTSATTGQYPFIGDSTGNWYVGYESSNIVLGRRGVTTDVNTTGFTLVANTWQHVVVTRQSTSTNDTRIFINGVLRGVGTTSQNYTITTTLNIGGLTGGYVTGYLSSTNLVKGSVPAAYQTSSTTTGTQIFTPPTSPSTSVTGTQLLLNYTNAGIYDATSKNDLETVGNAQISTTQSKWGGSSIYLDGTGDYLTTVSKQEIIIGTSTFTAEAWVYLTSSTTNQCIFGGSSANNPFALYINSSTQIAVDQYGTSEITFAVPTISLNAWYHVAVVRNSATTRVYLNGTESTTGGVSDSRNFSGATNQIGANQTSNRLLTGYIQDARITKGIARYTANFTAPTAAFPTL